MLNRDVESYLKVRRALGFGLKLMGPMLRSFARFAAQRGEAHVAASTAIEWASQAGSPFARDQRLKAVIRFARHARAEDERHQIPPEGVFGAQRPRQRLPYLFSAEEISKLVEKASCLGPRNSLVPHTYATLFGLLAATGLRSSEAFNLRFADITAEGLLIRATKFRKSRLVPLHETTAAALQRYLARRRLVASDEDYLFVGLRGRRLCPQSVRKVFASLLRAAGIRRDARLPKPCVHALRHTFAARSLERCPGDAQAIGRHMLALSTYLGHSSLASTFWYLQATPRLFREIAEASEAFLQGGAQ